MSLIDVRKEISFCEKVNLPLIGIVENMSGFVCGKCKVSCIVYISTWSDFNTYLLCCSNCIK